MTNEIPNTRVEITPHGWFYLAQESHRGSLECSNPKKKSELEDETRYRMQMALHALIVPAGEMNQGTGLDRSI